MEFIDQLLGHHSLAFHLAGVVFAVLGSLIAKYHFYRRHTAVCDEKGHDHNFSVRYWIGDNWHDVLVGLITSFLFVRFSAIFFHLEWTKEKLTAIGVGDLAHVTDSVFYYLASAIFIQYWIHKKYRKKKGDE